MKIVKFDNTDIEVIENRDLSNSEIAKGFGIQERVIRDHKSNHKDELIENKHFLTVTPKNPESLGIILPPKVRSKTYWTKRGVVRLGFFIKSERAKKFRDWAEDLIINSQETNQPIETRTDKNLKGLNFVFQNLKVNEASKILMTETLYIKLGLETNYLPKYSDENHTYSLSHLLKKFEVGISAKKLNLILLKEGYLEIKTRKSSGSLFDEETGEKTPKMKEFKSLTEKGLKFGKNIISPHNQLETQPHYFENSFMEFIESLKL